MIAMLSCYLIMSTPALHYQKYNSKHIMVSSNDHNLRQHPWLFVFNTIKCKFYAKHTQVHNKILSWQEGTLKHGKEKSNEVGDDAYKRKVGTIVCTINKGREDDLGSSVTDDCGGDVRTIPVGCLFCGVCTRWNQLRRGDIIVHHNNNSKVLYKWH